jgi:uncharacterized protein YdgA (DUF945 family)
MKKLIGLVVILTALVLGGYYGMGVVTERTLKRNALVINQSNSGLQLDIQQYERSWFTSLAKFHWRLHIPEHVVKNDNGQSSTVPAQDYDLDMPLKIYHGPIIFADSTVRFGLGYADTTIAIPPPAAKELTQQFAEMFTTDSIKPEVKISVLVNYLNRSRLRVEVPAFKLIGKNNTGTFEWFGFINDITMSANLGKIDGDLTIDGMKFVKDTTTGAVGKVSSEYSLHETKEGLYLGEANVSIPSLVVEDKGKTVFALEKFDVESSSDIDGGLFNSYFETSLDKILANNKAYGPGILKMSIKNLDAQVLAQINLEINKMQQGTDAEKQQAMMAILPQLPKLLSKGAEFQVSEMSFVMPEGKMEGNVMVMLPPGEISNPFQLIQKIQGEGKVKVPAVIVHQLLEESVKQQLKQPSLQQAMVEQMQQDKTKEGQGAVTSTATTPATDVQQNPGAPESGQTQTQGQAQGQGGLSAATQTQPQTETAAVKALSPAELEAKAKTQTDEKLASLVQSGILVSNGSDYVVEFKLADGQLTVNGQPFNPSAMKF